MYNIYASLYSYYRNNVIHLLFSSDDRREENLRFVTAACLMLLYRFRRDAVRNHITKRNDKQGRASEVFVYSIYRDGKGGGKVI